MLYGEITRQHLKLINEHVVADTIDYLEMKFSFQTDDWDGLEKWAHFAKNGVVYDIRLTDDCIRKEDHLNLSAGVWKVYLHGNEYRNGAVRERITTCVENLRVYPTGTLDGEPFPEMPASVTEQILARLDDLEENGGTGGGTGGITKETDPTVPDWAKQPEKPTYTASEVGALPASTKIPAKTSDLQNDSGFITAAVNALLNYYKKSETYTRTEVDAFIAGFDRRLNAVADSDDATLDQLSEIVAYIKANKSLIDSITTSKVSVSDIVNNLTTADVKKPLSAAQGKELKALYDSIRALYEAIVIPTKLPNPYALTFTGAATGTYDGSSAVTVHIPVVTDGGETVATEVYMRVSGGYIQYSTDNSTWKNVIAVADLKGDKGDKGDPGQDGEDGQDGTNGKDGVSATHSWNGTVLTVTSASGTSSADLKGDKGDTGEPGADGKDGQDGEPGANGITPHIGENGNWYIGDTDTGVKAQGESGRDYVLTEADKAEIAEAAADLADVPDVVQETGKSETAVMSQAAVTQEVDELSEAIGDLETEVDGKQPKGNYALKTELAAETTAREQAVADINARLGQQNLLIAEGETVEEALAWLETNGDKTKAYLMPDDFFYMWKETTEVGGVAYTNVLPLAKDTDRTTVYEDKGYITGYRLSSSGSLSALDGACVTGFIPANAGDIVRIKGIAPIQTSADGYVITYDSANTKIAHKSMPKISDKSDFSSAANTNATYSSYWNYTDGIITITLNTTDFGTGFDAIRFCAGTINENTIVTINEEIKEGGGTVVVEKWASTGHSLVSADYSTEIARLITVTDVHTAEINALKEAVESGTTGPDEDPLDLIRVWDAPIYDKTPVFLLDTEKTALTSSDKTVAAVYAKYDALMAENPRYITKTDLGMCSDGVTPVYRYDFCEPESRHQSGFEWSETKPKFIIVTGIHREWNGIYGMFHALSEITTNGELAELRRSVHFIVVPVLNPYSISGPYATVGHAANYNGVEIHRNFEVGFTVSGEGTIHYTGETALSEVESQYLDNILKANTDAAYFLTCHSFDRDKTWGVGFLWGSSATKYMCNMAFRVIDKMGRAWHKKYGTTYEEGIARENAVVLSDSTTYPNAKALEEGDYRIGHAALTNTGGCEQRQATKYGIQATNFETGETFFVLDSTSLSEKAITHGAEAYINFFLTAMGCYDFKDKAEYFKG